MTKVFSHGSVEYGNYITVNIFITLICFIQLLNIYINISQIRLLQNAIT